MVESLSGMARTAAARAHLPDAIAPRLLEWDDAPPRACPVGEAGIAVAFVVPRPPTVDCNADGDAPVRQFTLNWLTSSWRLVTCEAVSSAPDARARAFTGR